MVEKVIMVDFMSDVFRYKKRFLQYSDDILKLTYLSVFG